MFKIVAFCCVLWKLCYFLTDRSCVIPPQISVVFGAQNSLRVWLDIKMSVSLFFTYLLKIMSLIAPAYKLNNSARAVLAVGKHWSVFLAKFVQLFLSWNRALPFAYSQMWNCLPVPVRNAPFWLPSVGSCQVLNR